MIYNIIYNQFFYKNNIKMASEGDINVLLPYIEFGSLTPMTMSATLLR